MNHYDVVSMARSLRCLLAISLVACASPPAWAFEWPRWDIGLDTLSDAEVNAFSKYSHTMWTHFRDKAQFCVGKSEGAFFKLLQQSFPLPLPMSDKGDPICSNETLVVSSLCRVSDIKYYFQFVAVEDIEKIPNTESCTAGPGMAPACAPGFFDPGASVEALAGRLSQQLELKPTVHPCCEGYFCPQQLNCLIPCPLGAYCPRAMPAPPPPEYQQGPDDQSRWCAPYAYKERLSMNSSTMALGGDGRPLQMGGCGGADKWTWEPSPAAKQGKWDYGSGNIFCDGGMYCPNTTSKLLCSNKHYCREGSTAQMRCPPLVQCAPGTEAPQDHYTGVSVIFLLFFCVWLIWVIGRSWSQFKRHTSAHSRLRLLLALDRPPGLSQADLQSLSGMLSPGGPRAPPSLWGEDAPSSFSAYLAANADARPEIELPEHVVSPPLSPAAASSPGLQGGRGFGGGGELRSSASGTGCWMAARDMLAQVGSPRSGPSSVRSFSVGRAASVEVAGMRIEFFNLGLELKGIRTRVLKGVTGKMEANRLTAIMGPSGAGKTTLMNVLAGKALSYGVQSGRILVNGREDRLERYKPVMGFVPQDDVMSHLLTVEENLMFAARFRLPSHYGHTEHMLAVEHAIQTLDLEAVRHNMIGNVDARGVSGGQRKRVNIGLELVADPSLLFLDEPTSGLDSSSSKRVVFAVQQVARMGVTTAAVIHQPSWEIFCLFDDVLLLGKGGQTVYYGPQNRVQSYFNGLGFRMPERANPADAVLDIIAGITPRLGHPEFQPNDLFALWSRQASMGGASAPASASASPPAADALSASHAADAPGTSPGSRCLPAHSSNLHRLSRTTLCPAAGVPLEPRPAADVPGYGLQRQPSGMHSVRSSSCLTAELQQASASPPSGDFAAAGLRKSSSASHLAAGGRASADGDAGAPAARSPQDSAELAGRSAAALDDSPWEEGPDSMCLLPRTLANAFREPCSLESRGDSSGAASLEASSEHALSPTMRPRHKRELSLTPWIDFPLGSPPGADSLVPGCSGELPRLQLAVAEEGGDGGASLPASPLGRQNGYHLQAAFDEPCPEGGSMSAADAAFPEPSAEDGETSAAARPTAVPPLPLSELSHPRNEPAAPAAEAAAPAFSLRPQAASAGKLAPLDLPGRALGQRAQEGSSEEEPATATFLAAVDTAAVQTRQAFRTCTAFQDPSLHGREPDDCEAGPVPPHRGLCSAAEQEVRTLEVELGTPRGAAGREDDGEHLALLRSGQHDGAPSSSTARARPAGPFAALARRLRAAASKLRWAPNVRGRSRRWQRTEELEDGEAAEELGLLQRLDARQGAVNSPCGSCAEGRAFGRCYADGQEWERDAASAGRSESEKAGSGAELENGQDADAEGGVPLSSPPARSVVRALPWQGSPLRATPGFLKQFYWCICVNAQQRMREMLNLFVEYSIFGLTGALLGLMTKRGRGNIRDFQSDIIYSIVAVGLLATVSALKTFGRNRAVFFRQAASGLNRMAFFWAADVYDQLGTVLKSAFYLTLYYSFAQPRAVVWQMYLVTAAIVYACTGAGYLFSQLIDGPSAQLASAVFALINALIASHPKPQGLMALTYKVCFARWGLEGYVISEANRLTGVWLLSRCLDLQLMGFAVTHFWLCLLRLLQLGLGLRGIACFLLFALHRDKQR